MSDSSMQKITTKIRQCVEIVSPQARYQYVVIVLICLVWIQITYSAMIGSYVFMNPLFVCNGQSTTEVDACIDLSQCEITNNFTAAFYDKLYCDRKSIRSAIQSIYAFGALVGMFGLPALSDVKGRRFSFLFGFILQIVGITMMIIGVYQDVSALSIIGQFLTGIFASGMVVLTYVMTGQYCKDSIRQTALMIYNSMWGLTQISFYFLYNYLPEWQNYLIQLILIPSVILGIASIFLIYETPDYCLIMAKDNDLFKVWIQKIANFNKSSIIQIQQSKKLGEQIMQQLKLQQDSTDKATFKQTTLKIFKSKFVLKTCLCLALCQLSYNVFYYGVQGSLERTGFNYGFSMLLVGVHEFLAYLTASYFIKKIGRKKGLIISIIITSAIGLTFLLNIVKNNDILQSVVISVTRVGCVYAYSFLSILQTESFTGQIKSTAIGLTIGLSQLGRIGVPYLITGMNDIGVYPVIAASTCFLVFGIPPICFVKQTWKEQQQSNQKSITLISQKIVLEN